MQQAGKESMGRLDRKDRPFFADAERFAELININLYQGEKVLVPENLRLMQRKYPSLGSESGENERDVMMLDKGHHICYGLEIETESDYSMPERVFVYDACEYEYQIKAIHKKHIREKDYKHYREKKSRIKGSDFLLPIITVVLYLGEEGWTGRNTLLQMFHKAAGADKISERYIREYGFPLIEVHKVKPEDYQTELREFFQAMHCREDRKRMMQLLQTERFQNLSAETEQAIAEHLHMKGLIEKMEKEGVPMCKAIRDWMEEERREGQKEGKREEKIYIIRRMIEEGMDEHFIRKITQCTKTEFAAAGK